MASIIEIIGYMHAIGDHVAANIYLAAYLHIARTADVKNWVNYFK